MSSVLLWKEEPRSPFDFDEASLVDVSLYQTSLDQYDIKFDADLAACESKAEVASHILENLENLMDLDDLIKEESFLLDEKILPTILNEVEPPRAVPVPVQNLKSEYPDETQYLLQEFQTMYDVVELAHTNTKPPQGTLTPPQSPPGQAPPLLTTLEPLLNYSVVEADNKVVVFSVPEKQFLENYTIGTDIVELNYPPVATPQPDIAHELAVVEELVRSRVETMQWSSSPGSPGGSSSSCSNFGDCSSSSDDPEWVPDAVDSVADEAPKPSRKRARVHSKGAPEEKRVRKKEQNKNAATRYRMKKKAQVEEILTEEKQLQNHKAELGDKVSDLEREIKYLKGLMRDLFKAKGLIN
ncbi:bZIP transcription factor crc isoform X1 [Leptinotarsa decemlineata]|uniref:bZIP transcription factor crc isoform X1 n=1 Tax=Leptinotarsa decemlineata TaxID=7539 RepID=UPI003D30A136